MAVQELRAACTTSSCTEWLFDETNCPPGYEVIPRWDCTGELFPGEDVYNYDGTEVVMPSGFINYSPTNWGVPPGWGGWRGGACLMGLDSGSFFIAFQLDTCEESSNHPAWNDYSSVKPICTCNDLCTN